MQKSSPAPGPQQHEAVVHHDPGQPGRKLRFSLKLMQMLERAPIGVLCFIFCIAAIPQNSGSQSHAETMMPSNQFAKCLSVAAFCEIYKILVGIIAMSVHHERALHQGFSKGIPPAATRSLSVSSSLRTKSSRNGGGELRHFRQVSEGRLSQKSQFRVERNKSNTRIFQFAGDKSNFKPRSSFRRREKSQSTRLRLT